MRKWHRHWESGKQPGPRTGVDRAVCVRSGSLLWPLSVQGGKCLFFGVHKLLWTFLGGFFNYLFWWVWVSACCLG